MNVKLWSVACLSALLVTACGGPVRPVQINHLHGLGFSADGKQLIVPAHDGLLIYDAGQWRVPEAPVNDYMGYVATNSGFYSSGHPGPNSAYANPLGLVKSSDLGRTLTTLAFAGESDFHLVAVGYESHAIYVANAFPNSRLGVGLFYSLDEAATWTQSDASGLSGKLIQLAAHPTQANVIAAVTQEGVFVSDDFGQIFARLVDAGRASAATFSPEDGALVFGLNDLRVYNRPGGQVAAFGSAPNMKAGDLISYIAVNPVNGELAIATAAKDIFVTADRGQTWKRIADAGKGM